MAYSISAKFFKFAKKINSTRRPVEQPATMLERSVEIIEPFDLLNPTIKVVDVDLGEGDYTYFMQFNYVKLGDMNGNGREVDRYYWIKNWRRERGVNYAECEVDVLASWRGIIHGYEGHPNNQLVERSSKLSDSLPDNLRFTNGRISRGTIDGDDLAGWSWSHPYFYIQAFPSDALKAGQSTGQVPKFYRADSSSALDGFLKNSSKILYSSTTVATVTTNTPTSKSVNDFIGTVIALPYQISSSSDVEVEGMKFGDLTDRSLGQLEIGGLSLTGLKSTATDTHGVAEWSSIDISAMWKSESWLNSPQYVTATLEMSPFGQIDLPIDFIRGSNTIRLSVLGDIHGNLTLILNTSNSSIILGYANIAYPVERISAASYSSAQAKAERVKAALPAAAGIVGSMAVAAAGAYTGNIGQTVVGFTGALVGAEQAKQSFGSVSFPQGISVSTGGSGNLYLSTPRITWVRYEITDVNNNKYGRPLHQIKALGDCVADGNQPGFVQCSDANIDNVVEDYATGGRNGNASMTITEKQAICNYLNGGVYLE